MDLYNCSKKFDSLVNSWSYLSEETKYILKKYKCYNEEDALEILMKKYHMASPKEKRILKKAIDELKRQKLIKQKKSEKNQEKFYPKFGLGIELPGKHSYTTITPDYWYVNKLGEDGQWAKDKTITFIYIIPNRQFLYHPLKKGYGYMHITLIRELIKKGTINETLIPKELIEKYKELVKQTDRETALRIMIEGGNKKVFNKPFTVHGRTGILPRNKKPENTNFYASVWKPSGVKKLNLTQNILDQLYKDIRLKLKVPIRGIFHNM